MDTHFRNISYTGQVDSEGKAYGEGIYESGYGDIYRGTFKKSKHLGLCKEFLLQFNTIRRSTRDKKRRG